MPESAPTAIELENALNTLRRFLDHGGIVDKSVDEDVIDIAIARTARAEIDAGALTIPGDVAHRIFDGENPVRVWREFRNLKQKDLAEKSGIQQSYLSQIERGLREGTLSTMRKIADALGTSVDYLLPVAD